MTSYSESIGQLEEQVNIDSELKDIITNEINRVLEEAEKYTPGDESN